MHGKEKSPGKYCGHQLYLAKIIANLARTTNTNRCKHFECEQFRLRKKLHLCKLSAHFEQVLNKRLEKKSSSSYSALTDLRLLLAAISL